MANGNPRKGGTPGALRAIQDRRTGAREFDADARREERENTPITIEGIAFRRARKNWAISRRMRQIMRVQESGVALAARLRGRIAELESEQIEAAARGDDDRDAELEVQVRGIVGRSDDATEEAELSSYRLLALLLVPPTPAGADEDAAPGGFGLPDDDEDPDDFAIPAVEFLQDALDIEDAAGMAQELTGSREPDPQETPSSEAGSS